MSLLNEIRKIGQANFSLDSDLAESLGDVDLGLMELLELPYFFFLSPSHALGSGAMGVMPHMIEYTAIESLLNKLRTKKAREKGEAWGMALHQSLPFIDPKALRQRIEGDANA